MIALSETNHLPSGLSPTNRMTIKFSDEQLKRYGCNTQEEIIAALDRATHPPPPPAPAVALVAPRTEAVIVGLEGWKSSLVDRIASVEAALKTISPETILASVAVEAKKVASSEVSAAIARSGGAALGQNSPPADPAPGAPKVDPNDFGAQYDKDAAIREEFTGGRASYIKFMEASKAGRIRDYAQRNVETLKN